MPPSLLDTAIRVTPRARLWMFSSVTSSLRLPNSGSVIARKASIAGSMLTMSYLMPIASAQALASSSEWALV